MTVPPRPERRRPSDAAGLGLQVRAGADQRDIDGTESQELDDLGVGLSLNQPHRPIQLPGEVVAELAVLIEAPLRRPDAGQGIARLLCRSVGPDRGVRSRREWAARAAPWRREDHAECNEGPLPPKAATSSGGHGTAGAVAIQATAGARIRVVLTQARLRRLPATGTARCAAGGALRRAARAAPWADQTAKYSKKPTTPGLELAGVRRAR
jgi:hypothetical protein